MSEKKENLDLKELDENIQVYDNDDAYIFGEIQGNNYNEYLQINNKINSIYNNDIINNNQLPNNNELFNKLNINYIHNEENKKDGIYNNNSNINSNKNIKNINKNIQDITFNKKFTLNDIDSDLDNEKNPFKIKNSENINENQKNNNYNNNEIENNEESNDSNIPLVTLNFLSICQCCKDPFNSTDCIPYLFKCGHFFCKKCIVEQFIDEEGIKCPNDGLVAKSISELKILNNFITDKTVTQRTTNSSCIYCNYHKGQKLTHYIEETKELICIYCAFEKFKQNPNYEINK